MKKIYQILHYNLKLLVNYKLIFLLLIFITFNILNVFQYNQNEHITLLDVIILNFGNYQVHSMSVVFIAKALFPYIIFAFLIELYINEQMGNRAIYTLLRIESFSKWLISNYLMMVIIAAIYFLIYDIIVFKSAIIFFEGIYIGKPFIEFSTEVVNRVSLLTTFFNIFLIQVIGAMFYAMIQLLVTIFTKKRLIGYLFVVFLYIFNLTNNSYFWFINHIKLYRYNIIGLQTDKHSVLLFCYINLALIILLATYISYYIKKKKTVFDVT